MHPNPAEAMARGLAFLAMAAAQSPEEIWARQNWTAVTCKVIQTGVAYRGSCNRRVHGFPYAECTEQGPVLQRTINPWYDPGGRYVSTSCELRADRRWRWISGRRLGCSNQYLPWALVALNGKRRCAFRYGQESLSEMLSESLKNPGKPVRCFVLPDDDECAVALEYPMTSLVAGDDDSQGSGPVFIVGAAVCLCVCCCLVELMNVRKAVDARSLEECQAYALVE
ncbi:unnamed protein product [Effrenium voratum]|nr:unnamed protein product [Effrenium voratum]